MHCLGQNENWLLLILNGGRGGLIWDACVRFVHAVQHDRIVRAVIGRHLASDWGGGGKTVAMPALRCNFQCRGWLHVYICTLPRVADRGKRRGGLEYREARMSTRDADRALGCSGVSTSMREGRGGVCDRC